MDYTMKLFFALSIVLMGMTNFYGFMGLDGVEGQAPPVNISLYPLCDRTIDNIRAGGGWDSCKAAGVFKSNSKCYNAAPNKYVYRYDYFKCTKYGSSFILTPFNCTGPPCPIQANDGSYDLFNRYVQGSGCTGTCPPPPPPPPPASTTAAPDTTTPAV